MSISELFDKGASHPWANLRFGNLTLDGLLTFGSASAAQGTLSIIFNGPFAATAFNVNYQKIGKKVTLNFPDVIVNTAGGGTNNSNIFSSTNLPATLLPDLISGSGTVRNNFVVAVSNSNLPQTNPGLLQISNTGGIFISFNIPGSSGFSNAAGARGMYATSFSYLASS